MTPREEVGRRASASAVPSLVMVFAAFFLPTIPSCTDVRTPLEWARNANAPTETLAIVAAGWTPFLLPAALLVAVVAGFALGRAPGRVGQLVLALLVAELLLADAGVALLFFLDQAGEALRWSDLAGQAWIGVAPAAAQAIAVTALWLGRRHGWEGLAWRIVAWWALFAVSAPVLVNVALAKWPPALGSAVALAGWVTLPIAMAVAALSAWVARGRTLLVGQP